MTYAPRMLCMAALATGLLTGVGAGCRQTRAAADDNQSGQWPMVARDYQNRRFSELGQISTSNVGNLKVAWTFSTGIPRGHESAPLVVGDTMYLVTPFPNRAYAFDLRNPGGKPKWMYRPQPSAAAQGVACCDVVNRGPAFADGKLVFNTLDAHTVAVDAETGHEVWNAALGDINKGETITMAPLVVHGKVLVGNSGGEFGVRGWLTALDLRTGKVAWRAYSTGSDADCLDRRRLPSPLRGRPRSRSRHSHLAARQAGAWAGAPSGDSCRTTRCSTSFITARPTRACGTRRCARATTNGRRASSRGGPITGRRSGSTNGARTISMTTTASTRTCSSTCRWAAERARSSGTPTATATSTCSIARRAKCCRRPRSRP